nr:RecName: Full=Uncharacterized protein SMPP16 [Nautilus macromphalus]
FIAGLNGLR